MLAAVIVVTITVIVFITRTSASPTWARLEVSHLVTHGGGGLGSERENPQRPEQCRITCGHSGIILSLKDS